MKQYMKSNSQNTHDQLIGGMYSSNKTRRERENKKTKTNPRNVYFM